MAICGAKTRSGKPCQKSAMENGRCALHGGKSTGAPKGNDNAMTHGIYSSVLSDEEKELFGNGKLRDLLSMAYIQHLRAVKTEQPEIAERLLGRIATIEKNLATPGDEDKQSFESLAESARSILKAKLAKT